MIAAQGGDPDAPLPAASDVATSCRRRRAGSLTPPRRAAPSASRAWRLGAGRARKEDPVSASAGVVCLAKPGDAVAEGQPLLELHTDDAARVAARRWRPCTAPSASARRPAPPLVLDRITA